ncbi:MAG: glycosyltransferase [Acidobacteria bacterium]|nr:glycosyltransferase [Acidobacteriota bacterium]
MKLVVFGLSITSTWGNGHGTTYRSLCRALAKRGHSITFFERDLKWYRENRDLPDPPFCRLVLYDDWQATLLRVRQELKTCDAVIVGSYFPDSRSALEEVFSSPAPVKGFYDIDTPITVAALREHGATDYLRASDLQHLDLYLSFTGGPMLHEITREFGARRAAPLYCSFDESQYHPRPPGKRFACDVSYMGTYAADRQPKLETLLCRPARQLPSRKFIVAGPQYPRTIGWPANVRRIVHLNARWHPHFYSSSRLTLNVTRREMVIAGYSPSVRLFEAAACGAAIASDNWPGLESFFVPGTEILLPASGDDVMHYVTQLGDQDLRAIGLRAAERVHREHSSSQRARQLEELIAAAIAKQPISTTARAS